MFPSFSIVILSANSLLIATRIKDAFPDSVIYGLNTRVQGADVEFDDLGNTVRDLYMRGTPLVVMCATGIIIRALAPLLQSKLAEPAVLAVAEDGSAVVPLLGGVRGVNVFARQIGEVLQTVPAITTTGEIRFGTCLLNPPPGFELRNFDDGKKFVSDLIAGKKVRIKGNASWLAEANLPEDQAGDLAITVTEQERQPKENELIFHPRTIVVGLVAGEQDLEQKIKTALANVGLSEHSIAYFAIKEKDSAAVEIQAVAVSMQRPLRLLADEDISSDGQTKAEQLARSLVPTTSKPAYTNGSTAIVVADSPESILLVGRSRGRLTVIGLGPGSAELMAPAVKTELHKADDIVGYETYVRMAGPFRPDQKIHASDNREEIMRSKDAFELAIQGRSVVVVSSGDPGVFAMASAVLEALHNSDNPLWHGVELKILPGISAAQAAASRVGAPLGHDFCIISLSDNLKPWSIIEKRLDHAAAGDFVMAFYNPISKARPHQLGITLDIIRKHRSAETVVVLGRDVGRPAEKLTITNLGKLTPDQVDMRTVVIIGSSMTQTFGQRGDSQWVYTPRFYPDDSASQD